ncbi:MAG: epimerase, partial [Acidobacteriota bacterium]|nr:epimerase [Acidobacteriota bacterium]
MEIRSITDLEEALSRPSEADTACLRRTDGDILILGASGKMGPSLARLCRRGTDAAGKPRRIIAVSRRLIHEEGVEALSCDLLDRDGIERLPECPNVLY